MTGRGGVQAVRAAGRTLARLLVAAMIAVGSPTAAARADSTRDASWQLDFLRVPEAQRVSSGDGVTVAVIDTGVDANHPDLVGNVLDGVDVWDPGSTGKGQRDLIGHGTALASLIAGHGHGTGDRDGVLGIAPKAKILPISVQSPTSPAVNPDQIGAAIEYAVDHGAQIICVAISGSTSSEESWAVSSALSRGVLIAAAAGNRPEDTAIGDPAAASGAIAVSSVDRSGTFSTTSVSGAQIGLAAPGVDIPVAAPGGRYRTVTGTSVATALVAGAAALVRSKYPREQRLTLTRRLLRSATDRGATGHDPQYGSGVLNPVGALTAEDPQPARATRQTRGNTLPMILGAVGAGVLALLGWRLIAVARTRRARR